MWPWLGSLLFIFDLSFQNSIMLSNSKKGGEGKY